jgi:hypothetical protein
VKKIVEFLKGKKTYITSTVIFAVAGLQAIGVEIPESVYALLGAMGLGFVRSGMHTESVNKK